MSQTGLGVMISMMGDNKDSENSLKLGIGKKITDIQIQDNALRLVFGRHFTLIISDEGRNCCESRYMRSDDNLKKFVGGKLLDAVSKSAPDGQNEYGYHEIQFLDIKTSKGIFTLSNHNEHNGHYGGFSIKCRVEAGGNNAE